MTELNTILQVSCITLLGLVGLLFLKHAKSGLNSWTGVGFATAIICYLLIDPELAQGNALPFYILLTGAISIPVFFFLLSKAIFDDHFKVSSTILLWFAIEIVPHFHIYLRDQIAFTNGLRQFLFIISEIISIGFVLAGLYTAVKTRKADMVESRLRFRNIFIIITAALIGITLIVESIPLDQDAMVALQVLQRSSILALTGYFLLSNFHVRPGFFFNDLPKERPGSLPVDNALRLELEDLIVNKKIYRKEGLTILELAETLNEQEYRVRRLINHDLGFKNFNDFLNKYRVAEACEILSDQSKNRRPGQHIHFTHGKR